MVEGMSGISTHVLDLSQGRPATGVAVRLERRDGDGWTELSRSVTDADGRVQSALSTGEGLRVGSYRLCFETGAYFRETGTNCFHPYIVVAFEVLDSAQDYHVPLLISPYSYSTYRGS
jgi:5-hydroxyisourate hydrolase